jgi:hypothetical protein
MRKKICESCGMLDCIGPEPLRCTTVKEKTPGNALNNSVASLSCAILLWGVRGSSPEFDTIVGEEV